MPAISDFTRRLARRSLPCWLVGALAAPAGGQIAQLPETPAQHRPMAHHMNLPDEATAHCAATFTYDEGPRGPSHWPGQCVTGSLQSPIDIGPAQRVSMVALALGYESVGLHVVNDCDRRRIVLRFPDNHWLKVGKKPYFLSEIDFHAPAENAVRGRRARMAVHLIHLSAESLFLVIEIPVIPGRENRAFDSILRHAPEAGRESSFDNVKIDPSDFLPVDRSYYRFQGSLTAPLCNEGVTWIVMKNPIQFSAAQIAAYERYYHDTARPLQPLNGRPVAESR